MPYFVPKALFDTIVGASIPTEESRRRLRALPHPGRGAAAGLHAADPGHQHADDGGGRDGRGRGRRLQRGDRGCSTGVTVVDLHATFAALGVAGADALPVPVAAGPDPRPGRRGHGVLARRHPPQQPRLHPGGQRASSTGSTRRWRSPATTPSTTPDRRSGTRPTAPGPDRRHAAGRRPAVPARAGERALPRLALSPKGCFYLPDTRPGPVGAIPARTSRGAVRCHPTAAAARWTTSGPRWA